jgi:hypothetical protein
MTTVGRWSPNKVRARVLDGTWVSPEELGGMVLLTPTSIAYTGTSATVGENGLVEFTAISSLSLNGVFSADYDNYSVVITAKGISGNPGSLYYRLRSSGTDNSTASSYVSQYIFADNTSVSGFRQTQDFGVIGGVIIDTKYGGNTLNMYGPYLAQPTAARGFGSYPYISAAIYDNASTHNQTTSYDGITIFPNLGTMTGTVSVYGLVGA